MYESTSFRIAAILRNMFAQSGGRHGRPALSPRATGVGTAGPLGRVEVHKDPIHRLYALSIIFPLKDGNCIRRLLIPLQMETFACLLSSPNEQLE